MSHEAVARRYARAVFELVKEQGKVTEAVRQLGAFAEAYEASSDFRALEHTPSITDADRRGVVEQMGKQVGASDTIVRTVSILAERKRLAILPDLLRLLEEKVDDHLGVVRATVRSAARLPEDYRGKLKRKLEDVTGKRVLFTFEEDPSLIAGIVTQIGDRVVDGSIRGKLNQLAESLRQT